MSATTESSKTCSSLHDSPDSSPRSSNSDKMKHLAMNKKEPSHPPTIVDIRAMERPPLPVRRSPPAHLPQIPPRLLSEIRGRPSLYAPPLPHPSFQPENSRSQTQSSTPSLSAMFNASLPVSFHPSQDYPQDKIATPLRKGWLYSDRHLQDELQVLQASFKMQQSKLVSLDHNTRYQRSVTCSLFATLMVIMFLIVVAFVGTIAYLSNAISQQIETNSITTDDLQDVSITHEKIASAAVIQTSLSVPLLTLLTSINNSFAETILTLPKPSSGFLPFGNTRALSVEVDNSTMQISSSGAISIAPKSIHQLQLSNQVIGSFQLAIGSVTSAALAKSSVQMSSLGGDVLNTFSSIALTSNNTLASSAQSGYAIQVATNHQINVIFNTSSFLLGPVNNLAVYPNGINGIDLASGSIVARHVSESLTQLLPVAGLGLVNRSGVFSLNPDIKSVAVVDNALSMAQGGVGNANIVAGSVDSAKISPMLMSSWSGVFNLSMAAFQATESLSVLQSSYQQQLLQALNITDSNVMQTLNMSANIILTTMELINSTASFSAHSVSDSALSIGYSVQTQTQSLESSVNSTFSRLYNEIPRAGVGLLDFITSSSTQMDVAINTSCMAYNSQNMLTLAIGGISTDLLKDGSIQTWHITSGAVTSDLLADNAVTSSKLAEDVAPLAIFFNFNTTGILDNTLVIGFANQSAAITAAMENDLIVQAATGFNISIIAKGQSSFTIFPDKATDIIATGSLTLSSALFTKLNLKNGGFKAKAAGMKLLVPYSDHVLQMNNDLATNTTNLELLAETITITAQSGVSLTASNLVFNDAVVQSAVPVLLAAQQETWNFTFGSLPSNYIRLTGMVGNSVVVFSQCNTTYAGISVTIYNQMEASDFLIVPTYVCSRPNNLYIPTGKRVTMTCTGITIDCDQSELAGGGYTLPSSALVITDNIVNGTANASTAAGIISIAFTPWNNNPIISFQINSLLFVQGSSSLLITPVSSGFVNTEYSSDKESPLWICSSELLTSDLSGMFVTMVNVGDPLYAAKPQILQFLFTII